MDSLYMNDGTLGDFSDSLVTELLIEEPEPFKEHTLVLLHMQNVNDTDTQISMYLDEEMIQKLVKHLQTILVEFHDDKPEKIKS